MFGSWNELEPNQYSNFKKQLGSNINLKDHFADLTAKLENQKKIYIEGTRNSKSLTDFYQKSVFKPKT
jgi:hypothetical protein